MSVTHISLERRERADGEERRTWTGAEKSRRTRLNETKLVLPSYLSTYPSISVSVSIHNSFSATKPRDLRILLREDIMRGGKIIWTAAKFEGTTRSLVRKSERYGVSPCIHARLSGF